MTTRPSEPRDAMSEPPATPDAEGPMDAHEALNIVDRFLGHAGRVRLTEWEAHIIRDELARLRASDAVLRAALRSIVHNADDLAHAAAIHGDQDETAITLGDIARLALAPDRLL